MQNPNPETTLTPSPTRNQIPVTLVTQYVAPDAASDAGEVTLLLREMSAGDPAATAALVPMIYDDLRSMARAYLRRERQDHTLQATALVNEVYLRLLRQSQSEWNDRGHFFCTAARMMRRILVDSSRHRRRKKRGSGEIALDIAGMEIAAPACAASPIDILALHEALEQLSLVDERMVRIVELRFFAGCSNEEVATLLHISEPTVKRNWATARAWLFRFMQAS